MEDCSHSICYICKNVLPDYRAEIQKLRQEIERLDNLNKLMSRELERLDREEE